MADDVDEVELLRGMVNIYSPTGQTDAIRDHLLERARALGLEARVDDACNVIMTTGNGGGEGGGKDIMFLCHMDTVPGDLRMRMEGPILHGRGSVDAKGCLAAAMIVASANKGTTKGTVTVVVVPDEEGPSLGVREVVKGGRPDMVIVGEPSGWEGITIGYKGALRLRYEHATGKSHSGLRQQGSAELAVEFWGALEAFCIQESEAMGGGGGGLFDMLSPSLLSINTDDDGRRLRTCMDLDVRTPPGYDVDRLLGFIDMNRAGATVEVVGREPPVLVGKNNDLVKALIWAIRHHEGDPRFKKKTGTSDMNVAAEAWEGVPIVAYGPGDSSLDHSPEERIDIREYRKAIDILKMAVGRILEKG